MEEEEEEDPCRLHCDMNDNSLSLGESPGT